ncbi:hypothetical protein HBI23_256020 [Parastagonospora nodorum]|nr:hypothetical protein HBI23_256020 [Parastagonospora nodorum]KAH5620472.1 hypothetical protein HBI51_251140 [Parastagonospora nodorum]KAH5982908.1 hypothetical protein HBI84_250020 [Parastagonospora nodorum]KAH6132805.1 hypothetical protein HBI68_255270 [Parastagonospora nodorum]KAH6380458.1 hypothetical protein HBI08_238880 [Parastagonospora nodorum]
MDKPKDIPQVFCTVSSIISTLLPSFLPPEDPTKPRDFPKTLQLDHVLEALQQPLGSYFLEKLPPKDASAAVLSQSSRIGRTLLLRGMKDENRATLLLEIEEQEASGIQDDLAFFDEFETGNRAEFSDDSVLQAASQIDSEQFSKVIALLQMIKEDQEQDGMANDDDRSHG